jgi:ketosteroid isomerase-like protein
MAPMSDTDLEARATTARIVAALEAADYPALAGLYAPDAVLDMNLPTWRFQHQGADQIRTYFREQTGGLANLRCTQCAAANNDDTVMVESECRFDGDDGEYLWRCVDIFSIDSGQITRHTQYCTGCWTPSDIARQIAEAPMVRW